jgi:thioredoxin reductase
MQKEVDQPQINYNNTMSKEFLKMQKLAGLITESQIKTILNENKVKNQYVVKDEELSDADGDFYYIDEKKALTYLKQFNKSAGRYIRDEEGFGEFSTSIDNVQKMTDKQLERDMRDDMELYFGD